VCAPGNRGDTKGMNEILKKTVPSPKFFLTYRITNEVHVKFKFELNVGSGPHSLHISVY
jgi:hypothetical protein